ncbi:hypothetical protein HK104_009159 [Borealophlyctis nickersoniae]|nr:hypothetical protein HK104_009159 [Borealophlyctis nickersoniae]
MPHSDKTTPHGLLRLSNENLERAFIALTPPAWNDLRTARRVCRRWRDILSSGNIFLWRHLLIAHFDFTPHRAREDAFLVPQNRYPDGQAPPSYWVEEWMAWKFDRYESPKDSKIPGTFHYRPSQFAWLHQCQLSGHSTAHFKSDQDAYTLYADLTYMTHLVQWLQSNDILYRSETDAEMYPFILDLPMIAADDGGVEMDREALAVRVLKAFGFHPYFFEHLKHHVGWNVMTYVDRGDVEDLQAHQDQEQAEPLANLHLCRTFNALPSTIRRFMSDYLRVNYPTHASVTRALEFGQMVADGFDQCSFDRVATTSWEGNEEGTMFLFGRRSNMERRLVGFVFRVVVADE